MSFLQTAARAVRLAREYSAATDAALERIEAGQPLPAAIRAFASHTENKLDDAAAEVLIDGLTKTIDTAAALARLASVLSPRVAEWGVSALKLERRLRSIRG